MGEPKNTLDKEHPGAEGELLGDKSSNDHKSTKPDSPKVKEEKIDPDLDAKPKGKGKGVDPKEKGKHYKEFKDKDKCEWENFIRERSEIPGGGYFRARSNAPRGRDGGPPSDTLSSSSDDDTSSGDESGGSNSPPSDSSSSSESDASDSSKCRKKKSSAKWNKDQKYKKD
ncbi:hypothetical protein BDQ12DRAFT_727996 [Crucibulum laeve]|uniref:Uncharacterized protein n=1 Tax=Crucibulum laeve TaxID=68775 RepID=A0A5C3LKM2_9AGAR|nr:hypothetical protein BDQ12DRAFT_727996 [Crucibulum laeve]